MSCELRAGKSSVCLAQRAGFRLSGALPLAPQLLDKKPVLCYTEGLGVCSARTTKKNKLLLVLVRGRKFLFAFVCFCALTQWAYAKLRQPLGPLEYSKEYSKKYAYSYMRREREREKKK